MDLGDFDVVLVHAGTDTTSALCPLQVLTAEQQESLCRLSAVARGFLTRRLLETEKVKHLRQTVAVRRHTHMHAHTQTHTHTYAYTHINTHTHTHMHTHT